MKLFGRKKEEEDIDTRFKKLYKNINETINQAQGEHDLEIQLSLLELAATKYDTLLLMIDQGANFEKKTFVSYQQHVRSQIDVIKGIENED